jgi:hypothetical protein
MTQKVHTMTFPTRFPPGSTPRAPPAPQPPPDKQQLQDSKTGAEYEIDAIKELEEPLPKNEQPAR